MNEKNYVALRYSKNECHIVRDDDHPKKRSLLECVGYANLQGWDVLNMDQVYKWSGIKCDPAMERDLREAGYSVKTILEELQSRYHIDIDRIELEQFDSPSKMDPCKRIIEKVKINLDL